MEYITYRLSVSPLALSTEWVARDPLTVQNSRKISGIERPFWIQNGKFSKRRFLLLVLSCFSCMTCYLLLRNTTFLKPDNFNFLNIFLCLQFKLYYNWMNYIRIQVWGLGSEVPNEKIKTNQKPIKENQQKSSQNKKYLNFLFGTSNFKPQSSNSYLHGFQETGIYMKVGNFGNLIYFKHKNYFK